MDIFRERLRERADLTMEKHGWAQTDMAERLGVSRTRFNNWLNTAREPSMQSLASLCELTETNPAYLLGFTDDPSWPPSTNDLQRIEDKLDKLIRDKK